MFCYNFHVIQYISLLKEKTPSSRYLVGVLLYLLLLLVTQGLRGETRTGNSRAGREVLSDQPPNHINPLTT